MFKLELETESAAFKPTQADAWREVARILRNLADKVDGSAAAEYSLSYAEWVLLDSNGNQTGSAMITTAK